MFKRLFSSLFVLLILSVAFYACTTHSKVFGGNGREPLSLVEPCLNTPYGVDKAGKPMIFLPHAMMRVANCKNRYADIFFSALPLINADPDYTPSISIIPLTSETLNEKSPKLFFDKESYTPYSFHTRLDRLGIDIDYSLTEHAAIYRMDYKYAPHNDRIFRIKSKRKGSTFKVNSHGHIEVTYPLEGTGKAKLYLYLKSEKPFHTLSIDSIEQSFTIATDNELHKINIKYGISLISIEQAEKNLLREIPDFEYNVVEKRAKNIWQNALQRIEIEGGTLKQAKILYSALYRALSIPICISEDNHYYSADLDSVVSDEGSPFYTFDLLSETHLALHPLLALVYPEVERAAIKSLIKMSQTSPTGTFPTFPTYGGNLTEKGLQNRSLVSLSSSYNRGFTDIDLQAVFKGALNAVSWYHPDEYDILIFNAIARKSGHFDAQIQLSKDTIDWASLSADSIAKSIRPYNIEDIVAKVDKKKVQEAINLAIEKEMDHAPTTNSLYLYYLYAYTGDINKSIRLLRNIQQLYFEKDFVDMTSSSSGASMAASIVFSMIGIYPVSPRKGTYVVGAPCFSAVRINNGTGTMIKIDAPNVSAENMYINAVELAGNRIQPYGIPHNKLTQGHKIVLKTTKRKNI